MTLEMRRRISAILAGKAEMELFSRYYHRWAIAAWATLRLRRRAAEEKSRDLLRREGSARTEPSALHVAGHEASRQQSQVKAADEDDVQRGAAVSAEAEELGGEGCVVWQHQPMSSTASVCESSGGARCGGRVEETTGDLGAVAAVTLASGSQLKRATATPGPLAAAASPPSRCRSCLLPLVGPCVVACAEALSREGTAHECEELRRTVAEQLRVCGEKDRLINYLTRQRDIAIQACQGAATGNSGTALLEPPSPVPSQQQQQQQAAGAVAIAAEWQQQCREAQAELLMLQQLCRKQAAHITQLEAAAAAAAASSHGQGAGTAAIRRKPNGARNTKGAEANPALPVETRERLSEHPRGHESESGEGARGEEGSELGTKAATPGHPGSDMVDVAQRSTTPRTVMAHQSFSAETDCPTTTTTTTTTAVAKAQPGTTKNIAVAIRVAEPPNHGTPPQCAMRPTIRQPCVLKPPSAKLPVDAAARLASRKRTHSDARQKHAAAAAAAIAPSGRSAGGAPRSATASTSSSLAELPQSGLKQAIDDATLCRLLRAAGKPHQGRRSGGDDALSVNGSFPEMTRSCNHQSASVSSTAPRRASGGVSRGPNQPVPPRPKPVLKDAPSPMCPAAGAPDHGLPALLTGFVRSTPP